MNKAQIIAQANSIITELSKFSGDIMYLGPPVSDNRFKLFEKQIGFNLPFDFKYILTSHNRIALMGTEIYGLDKDLRGSSLDEIYGFEHYIAANPMPDEFLPFSPDGRGNHYCLDLSKIVDYICPVVFWQHDYYYTNLSEVEICNDNLMDWIDEVMIGWTLENYNYDGSEK